MAGEVRTLLIPINEITVSPGRREAAPGDVKELADSILELGLINPVMVDQSYTLIAGLHRLEAMKLLGRTEIECTVITPELEHRKSGYVERKRRPCQGNVVRIA